MMEEPSQPEVKLVEMPQLRLVVGLGNPGERYRGTRHNTGFMVADALLKQYPSARKAVWQPERGELTEISLEDGRVWWVLKPMTYMNDSGEAVEAVTRQFGISPLDVLVICDDLDLPLGRLRMRPRGSCGGQRGVLSIIEKLGTSGFPRLRVGIGRPQSSEVDIIEYVLSRWTSAERELLEPAVQMAVKAVQTDLTSGLEAAMNQANSWKADCVNAEKQKGDPEIEKV